VRRAAGGRKFARSTRFATGLPPFARRASEGRPKIAADWPLLLNSDGLFRRKCGHDLQRQLLWNFICQRSTRRQHEGPPMMDRSVSREAPLSSLPASVRGERPKLRPRCHRMSSNALATQCCIVGGGPASSSGCPCHELVSTFISVCSERGLTTEEEWSVGHDPQHGAPVAHSGLYVSLFRMAQDALLPEQIFDLFLHRVNDSGRTIDGTESNLARVCRTPSFLTRCVYATTNA